jgi:hypothetical protein
MSNQQVRFSGLLTDFAVGYVQAADNFVANRVAPIVPVDEQTAKFRIFDKADFLRDEYAARAPGSPAASANFKQTLGTYLCENYSLKHPMPDELRKNYDARGPQVADKAASMFLAQKALIKRERLMVSKLVAASTWTAQVDQTGVASGPGANQFLQFHTAAGAEVATSNPIDVLTQAVEAVKMSVGHKANRILMPGNVWSSIRRHSVVRAMLSNDSLKVPTMQDVAALLDIPPDSIVVSNAVYNSAAEPAAATMAYAMGKHILVLYVDDNADISLPTASKQFSWAPFDDIKEAAASGAPGVRQWRDADESARTDWYGGEIYTDMKVTAADAGCYLTAVIG